MPKQEPFKMSDRTRDKIMAGLDGLEEVHRNLIINAMVDLCTEVEIHCRATVFEEIRQQWSGNLTIMLGMLENTNRPAKKHGG